MKKLIRENVKTLTPINFTIFILTNYKKNPEETKSNLLHFLKTDLDTAKKILDSLDVESILNESRKYLDVTEHFNAQTTIYTTFNTQLMEVDKFKDVYGQELNKTKNQQLN